MKLRLEILVMCLVLCGVVSAQMRPNIVVLLADDMGYGEVQALNPERCIVPTPNLDRLVHEGMTFTDGHSGASVCTPSRYALMTGRYCWRTLRAAGVGRGPKSYGGCMIVPDRMTLGALLRNQGYKTAFIGKWHQGFSSKGGSQVDAATVLGDDTHRPKLPAIGIKVGNTPYFRGFDYFFGYDNSGCLNWLVENDRVVQHCGSSLVTRTLCQRAAKYVDKIAAEKTDQPFFLYVAVNSPHLPIAPSKEWRGKSSLGIYGDFVMEMDWAFGLVIKALERSKLLDNTMLIFSADNGFCPRADEINAKSRSDGKTFEHLGHFPSGINRGNKGDLYEGGHRVPFLLHWPQGGVKAGSTCDELVCLNDLMATFADLLGAKLTDNVGEDSFSMLPTIRGEKGLRENVVHHTLSGNFAIRKGDWKMLFPGTKTGKTPDSEVYNLNQDRSETTDVFGKFPEVEGDLVRTMDDLVVRGRSTLGKPQPLEREINYRLTPRENIVGEGAKKPKK
jgi:arylsulfatase A-like enzyme